MATYDAGSDTVTLTGTEGSPDTLDGIVSVVGNTAKARKTGDYFYVFSFAVLNGATGFLELGADTQTLMQSVEWRRNGTTGGVIFRERSIARHEGSGYADPAPNLYGHAGYKYIAYQDRAGVNPQYILDIADRYDYFTCNDSPVESPTYQVSGLDLIQISGVASCKIFAASGSVISNLRLLTRGSSISEFQARSGLFSDLRLENVGFSSSNDAGLTITANRPVLDFLGSPGDLVFNFNNTALFEIIDAVFPAGAWTGNFTGRSSGFRSSSSCRVNVIFTDTNTFLSGATPVPMRLRHTPNSGSTIDETANSSGQVVGTRLLNAYRDGTSFSTGVGQAPNATYTWTAKARAFGYTVAGPDVLYSALAVSSARVTVIQVVAVAHIASASEAIAAALTGIALSASGSSGGTVTVSTSHSLQDIWDYYRAWISSFTNFGANDTWDFDGTVLDISGWNLSVTGAGVVLSGVRLTSTGTVSISSGGSLSPTVIVASAAGVSVPVTAPNLIDGTRVQVYDIAGSAELANALVSGGVGYVGRFTWSVDKTIRLRATYASGVLAKLPVQVNALLTNTGTSFLAQQTSDTIYATNAIDGSGVSEFSADYPNLQVDLADSDGLTEVQRLYAWWVSNLATASGIRNFLGGLVADDTVNYRIVTAALQLKLQNTNTAAVVVSGGRLYRDDGATVIAMGSGSIQMDPEKAYVAGLTNPIVLSPGERLVTLSNGGYLARA